MCAPLEQWILKTHKKYRSPTITFMVWIMFFMSITAMIVTAFHR